MTSPFPKEITNWNISARDERGRVFSIAWETADADFHVWVNVDEHGNRLIERGTGKDFPVVYKNLKPEAATLSTRTFRDGTPKTTYLDARKHFAVMLLVEGISQEYFDHAVEAYKRRQAEDEAKRRAAYIERLREDAARVGFKLVPVSA